MGNRKNDSGTQDEAITTAILREFLKQETDAKCRLCKECEETIDRLTWRCPILAKNENIIRQG
jgi:lipopolysaccharide biosynthesis regulator YciM